MLKNEAKTEATKLDEAKIKSKNAQKEAEKAFREA